MSKKILALMTVFVMLVTTLAASFPVLVYADTDVPQSGPNPIVFDQSATTDNLIHLMAAGSQHNSGLSVTNYGSPKHFWVNNFNDNTNDYLKWTVSLAAGATYHVWALRQGLAIRTGLYTTIRGYRHVLPISRMCILLKAATVSHNSGALQKEETGCL